MKKLIFTIILILNITLGIDRGNLVLTSVQKVYAQKCPNNVADPPPSGGGIFGFLGGVFQSIGNAISTVANAIVDFFSGSGDGETFGDENGDGNDYGWEPLDNGGYEPPDWGSYADPWQDPEF